MKARVSPDSGSYWDLDSGNSTWNSSISKYIRTIDLGLVHSTNCTALLRQETLTDIPTNCEVILTYRTYENGILNETVFPLDNASLNDVIFSYNTDNGCHLYLELRCPNFTAVPKLYWIDLHYLDVPIALIIYPPLNAHNVRSADKGIIVAKMSKNNDRGGTLGFGIKIYDAESQIVYQRNSYKTFPDQFSGDVSWGYALTYNESTHIHATDDIHWNILGSSRPTKNGTVGIHGAPNTSPLYIRAKLPLYLIGSFNMKFCAYNGTQTIN